MMQYSFLICRTGRFRSSYNKSAVMKSIRGGYPERIQEKYLFIHPEKRYNEYIYPGCGPEWKGVPAETMQLDYFFSYAEANIVCIVILAILLFHSRAHSTRQEKQIWYDRTIIAHILYFLSDIGWAAILSNQIPRPRFPVVLFNFINLVLLSSLAYAWFMYMAASVRLGFRNNRKIRIICLLPMGMFTLAMMIAYAAAPYFWVNENGELSAWYYPMLIGGPVIYLIAAFIFSMVQARKADSKESALLFRLIGIYPLAVMAFGLIQTFSLNAPLFCFGCTIMMLFFYIQNMQMLVSVDALTRLNNRGQINRYMRQTRYRDNVKTYTVMIDIDNFKEINDTYGHAEGDRALILVSEVLKQAVERTRSAVFLGRYGGDEFTVFLQCTEGDVPPDQMIEAIRNALKEKRKESGLPYGLNISVGYDVLRDRNDTMEASLVRADENLYRNKRAAKVGR